ncbi:MAG: hypothetical protein P8Z68_09985 [Kineosporiaceae bacterium]
MPRSPRPARRRTVLALLAASAAGAGGAAWWWKDRSASPVARPPDPVLGPGDPAPQAERLTGPGVTGRADQIAFTADGGALTWVEADGQVPRVDLTSGALTSGPALTRPGVRHVFSPGNDMVAVVGGPGRTVVSLQGYPDGGERARLDHDGEVDRVVFGPDGTHLLTRTLDGVYQVWDARAGAPVGPPVAADFGALGVSADGTRLAVESGLDGIRLCPTDGTGCRSLPSAPAGDLTLVFVPGTRFLAAPTVSAVDGQVRLWDTDTGQAVSALVDCTITDGQTARPAIIAAIAADRTGSRIAAATDDGAIRLWDVATARVAGPALTTQPGVRELALSPDGSTLVALGEDRVFTLWRVGGFRAA